MKKNYMFLLLIISTIINSYGQFPIAKSEGQFIKIEKNAKVIIYIKKSCITSVVIKESDWKVVLIKTTEIDGGYSGGSGSSNKSYFIGDFKENKMAKEFCALIISLINEK